MNESCLFLLLSYHILHVKSFLLLLTSISYRADISNIIFATSSIHVFGLQMDFKIWVKTVYVKWKNLESNHHRKSTEIQNHRSTQCTPAILMSEIQPSSNISALCEFILRCLQTKLLYLPQLLRHQP